MRYKSISTEQSLHELYDMLKGYDKNQLRVSIDIFNKLYWFLYLLIEEQGESKKVKDILHLVKSHFNHLTLGTISLRDDLV